jgi:hypothetical protein
VKAFVAKEVYDLKKGHNFPLVFHFGFLQPFTTKIILISCPNLDVQNIQVVVFYCSSQAPYAFLGHHVL